MIQMKDVRAGLWYLGMVCSKVTVNIYVVSKITS